MEKREQTVEVNGLHFHVDIEGEGAPLLLIMGLGSAGEKWWRNVREYKKHFTCISFDNRGAGRSDKPQVETYSTQDMAEDAIGILDALGVEKACVNGVSMGGAIAQYVAARHPQRVEKLILTSTFGHAGAGFRRAIELLRDAKDTMDPAQLLKLNQWMTFSNYTQENHPAFLREMADEGAAQAYPMPAFAYKAQCNACLGHDAMAELKNITAPTLVASGACDLFAPPVRAQELVREIPNAQLYMCENGGHVHEWEFLDAYNDATLRFLLGK